MLYWIFLETSLLFAEIPGIQITLMKIVLCTPSQRSDLIEKNAHQKPFPLEIGKHEKMVGRSSSCIDAFRTTGNALKLGYRHKKFQNDGGTRLALRFIERV